MIQLLKKLNKKQTLFILISIAFIILQAFFDLKLPDYMIEITTILKTPNSNTIDLLIPGGKMLLCALISFGLAVITSYFLSYVASSFSQKIRKDLFYKIQDFSLSEIKKFTTSSLIVRTTNDILNVQRFLAMGMQVMIKAPLLAILAILKIYSKNITWSLITGSYVVVFLSIVIILLKLTIPKTYKLQKLIDNLNTVARENITGIRVIKAFNAKTYQTNKFKNVNEEVTDTNLYIAKKMAFINPLINFALSSLTISIYYSGSIMINNAILADKLILFSNMVVFSSYASQVIMAFMMLVMISIIYPRAKISANRITEVLNTEISIQPGTLKNKINGNIQFKNVSFKYSDAEECILKNINLKINQGETIAFIGSTGSGKSTLVNLIPRLYDVAEGEILINNTNIKQFDLKHLNRHISYIPQKAVIFDGTIKSNVTYGSISKEEKKIYKALEIAQAKNFITKNEKKLNYKTASKGTNLSGGQKQRISIARGIFKNPEIFIFDDTFSALDYKTDFNLRTDLKKNLKNKTTIIVSQRINTIMHSDKIIVLNKGEIEHIGTHKELLKKSKTYLELAKNQLPEEELI